MMYFNRDGKHNFVDKNNVLLGYDSYRQCCENADWFLSDDVPAKIDTDCSGSPEGFDFKPYQFDPSFFREIADTDRLDSGGAVAFKIVAEGLPEKYIVLYNAHNGFYRHGFELMREKETLRSDTF